ncbi:hypothetical protein GCM10025780_10780 [Frondihabitans cladoniiphilus]|uniref:Immunity protein 52 domain-containing protein n=1 Tax=Frondihabitans cladoniiphilus TaxID=715785 RepID=A0ABP8VR99_9MICO
MTAFVDQASSWNREDVILRGFWGGRSDSVDELAARMASTTELLRSFGGRLARPWLEFTESPRLVPDDLGGWRDFVRRSVIRDDHGRPDPLSGHAVSIVSESSDGFSRAKFTVSAGEAEGVLSVPSNRFLLKFGEPSTGSSSDYPLDEEIVPIAGELLRGLVSLWKPDTAALLTKPMLRAQRGGPSRLPDVGAVSWFSPVVANLPSSLEGATLEAFGEGAILTVGAPGTASSSAEAVAAVRGSLLEQGRLLPAPPVQAVPPQVPGPGSLSPA